ncbi:MAG TPA: tetratricopeptide repeat protein [Chloroflexia bacterium]|nr:tetratricopeptide repeat protein [Chloroflexia bacterium]
MLSFFTRQGRIIFNAFTWKNRSARSFLIPKLFFLALMVPATLTGFLWLALLIWAGTELVWASWGSHEQLQEGFTRKRTYSINRERLGLAAIFGVVAWILFSFLPLWLALPLFLPVLPVLFGAFLYLNFKRFFRDLTATAPTALSPLYDKVRKMQELEATAQQMEMRLLLSKDPDERQDLAFYLGWAYTFQGHRLIPTKLWDKALSFYKSALQVDPTNMAARAVLVICYLHQGEFEIALREISRAIAVFNGQRSKVKYQEALWHWQRNEVSSEYEQSAALFQLCALAVGLLEKSPESGATKQLLSAEIVGEMLGIPGRTQEELTRLLSRKGGQTLGALHVMTAGLFREPANPLDLLEEAVVLPLLPIQTIEEAA